ncbi:hypothetical protein BD770DRAFT_427462 [Pilaira anomala]|nr:hypothetical protein BD770DRAFT_427462 [Pilaira anomala]
MPMKIAYEESKAELCKAMNLDVRQDIHIPAPLKMYDLENHHYTNITDDTLKKLQLSDDLDVFELNSVARALSSYLIESIVQFNKQWFFITEHEMYIRNNMQMVDCAQESLWLKYPSELEAHTLKKNENEDTWFELSLFFDKFEFFVTGGLRGSAQKSLEP